MKQNLKLLVFLAASLVSLRLPGQPCLGFGSVTSDKDSLFLPAISVITYDIWVKNVGNSTYDGPVLIKATYNAGPVFIWGYANLQTIAPGDSINFVHTDSVPINGTPYKGGDNTILVWPVAEGAQTCDTTEVGVWVDGVIGFPEPKENRRVDLYPVPATDRIKMNWFGGTEKVEYVRLMSVTGNEVFVSRSAISEIPLEGLAKGIYLLEVKYTDGFRGIYKISLEY